MPSFLVGDYVTVCTLQGTQALVNRFLCDLCHTPIASCCACQGQGEHYTPHTRKATISLCRPSQAVGRLACSLACACQARCLLLYALHRQTPCARLLSTSAVRCAFVCSCGTGYTAQGGLPPPSGCEPRRAAAARGAATPESLNLGLARLISLHKLRDIYQVVDSCCDERHIDIVLCDV